MCFNANSVQKSKFVSAKDAAVVVKTNVKTDEAQSSPESLTCTKEENLQITTQTGIPAKKVNFSGDNAKIAEVDARIAKNHAAERHISTKSMNLVAQEIGLNFFAKGITNFFDSRAVNQSVAKVLEKSIGKDFRVLTKTGNGNVMSGFIGSAGKSAEEFIVKKGMRTVTVNTAAKVSEKSMDKLVTKGMERGLETFAAKAAGTVSRGLPVVSAAANSYILYSDMKDAINKIGGEGNTTSSLLSLGAVYYDVKTLFKPTLSNLIIGSALTIFSEAVND
jgi:hypothetical protein